MENEITLYNDGTTSVIAPIAVPFLVTNIAENDTIIEKQHRLAESLVDEYDEGWGSAWADNCGSWNTTELYDNILMEYDIFDNVIDSLYDNIDIFMDIMNVRLEEDDNFVITESWLNANPPGNVQECHIHSYSHFAFVYYIHVPETDDGGGRFVLDNPLSYEWSPEFESTSIYSKQVEINVTNGDLILFPSNVEHHTRVNTANENRYSLAFNVAIDRYLPNADSSSLS